MDRRKREALYVARQSVSLLQPKRNRDFPLSAFLPLRLSMANSLLWPVSFLAVFGTCFVGYLGESRAHSAYLILRH